MASETRKPLVSAVTWAFGAPPGTRTPNPLILVRGFATTLDDPHCAGLTATYSSRSMNLASRRSASLLVQRRGLKGGFKGLIDTYVSRRFPVLRLRVCGLGRRCGGRSAQGQRATLVASCPQWSWYMIRLCASQ
jgi:hypothetical protein